MNSMLRGIEFQQDNAEKFFLHLDELINIAMYDWFIDDVDCNDLPFQEGRYSGSELKAALPKLADLSFARIRQYPIGAVIGKIDTYSDYAQSDCELLLLFYDGGVYELYAKDEALLHRLFQFASEHGFEQIEFKSEANDSRNRMFF